MVAKHYRRSPEEMASEAVNRYLLHLIEDPRDPERLHLLTDKKFRWP